jgi:hypothetical protein
LPSFFTIAAAAELFKEASRVEVAIERITAKSHAITTAFCFWLSFLFFLGLFWVGENPRIVFILFC